MWPCDQVASTSGSFEGHTAASPVGMLRNDSQNISKAAARQLKEKSLKARSGILGLLKEFAAILPDQIPASLSQLIPGIQQALQVCQASVVARLPETEQPCACILHGLDVHVHQRFQQRQLRATMNCSRVDSCHALRNFMACLVIADSR